MKLADIGFRALSLVGVPAEAARRLAPLGALLALMLASGAIWGAFKLWDWWDDRAAIEAATNKANAEFLERQVAAERKAGAAKDERDDGNEAAQDDLEKDLNDASKAGDTGADAVWNGGLWADPAD